MIFKIFKQWWFLKGLNSESKALHQPVTEIYRLAIFAHDEDHSNNALCTTLWSAVGGRDWAVNAHSKQGIEEDFGKVFESVADSLYKHEAHSLRKRINLNLSGLWFTILVQIQVQALIILYWRSHLLRSTFIFIDDRRWVKERTIIRSII